MVAIVGRRIKHSMGDIAGSRRLIGSLMSDFSRAALPPDAIIAPPAEAWLASIVESSFDAIISKDLNSTITTWNRAAERLFGYAPAEAVGRSILMLIPDHLQGEEAEIIGRIKRGEVVETYETTRRRKDGSLVEVSLTVSPIRDALGAIVGASKIARDISVTRENERRIRLLMAEVNHRVKNQFAVILSMIRETGRQSPEPAVFQQRVKDRIMALSRSHDLLVETEWTGTDLSALVTAQLESFEHREQVSVSGPLLSLKPMALQYLGIAFHELATNSAKYGALSETGGTISVSWEITPHAGGDRQFSLWWRESFAPRSLPPGPSREGFGTTVLKRITPSALHGRSHFESTADSVLWSVTAPLDALKAT